MPEWSKGEVLSTSAKASWVQVPLCARNNYIIFDVIISCTDARVVKGGGLKHLCESFVGSSPTLCKK